jgi:hypothetical protein
VVLKHPAGLVATLFPPTCPTLSFTPCCR